MRTEKLQLDDVRYNPERAGFEAVVRVHDDGNVFAYPAFVAAPLTAEFSLITRSLTRLARAQHKVPSDGLRLRRGTASEGAWTAGVAPVRRRLNKLAA